jgi:hypothetical protein
MPEATRERLRVLTRRLRRRAAAACWQLLSPDDAPATPLGLGGRATSLDSEELRGEIEALEAAFDADDVPAGDISVDPSDLSAPSGVEAGGDDGIPLWLDESEGGGQLPEPERDRQRGEEL